MSDQTTPDLVSVLRDLSVLAPDAFDYSDVMEPLCRVRVGGTIHAIEAADPSEVDLMFLQSALIALSKAKLGRIELMDGDTIERPSALILTRPPSSRIIKRSADSLVLALSLAVLAALKAVGA